MTLDGMQLKTPFDLHRTPEAHAEGLEEVLEEDGLQEEIVVQMDLLRRDPLHEGVLETPLMIEGRRMRILKPGLMEGHHVNPHLKDHSVQTRTIPPEAEALPNTRAMASSLTLKAPASRTYWAKSTSGTGKPPP